jgi:hypothetical protein
MGLGKTLSMLSAIISTIDSSRSYAVMHDTSEPSLPSGGTLVVVTSARELPRSAVPKVVPSDSPPGLIE